MPIPKMPPPSFKIHHNMEVKFCLYSKVCLGISEHSCKLHVSIMSHMAYMKKNKFKKRFKLQSYTHQEGYDRKADIRAVRYMGI